MLPNLTDVTGGKMFGYPAYYIHGKLFACIFEDGVGIKLPEDVAAGLLTNAQAVPFQPMGRPKMREWVRIDHQSSEDYRHDEAVFLRSIEFVGSLKKK